MKEKNIRFNYETISIVKRGKLIEYTRELASLLTEEEFIEIMMIYGKVIDRLSIELENKEWIYN